MKEVSLEDFVAKHGQTRVAKILNVSQGAIWQMLKNSRKIIVCIHDDASVSAYEKKPIGRSQSAA